MVSRQVKVGYALVFIVAVAALLFLGYQLSVETTKNHYEKLSDQLLHRLRAYVEEEKSASMSLAIALAENISLKNALAFDHEEEAYLILKSTMDSLETYTSYSNMYAQIITKDLKVFVRSWDREYTGFELGHFREDLVEAKERTEPKVAIEAGRILSFKALAPLVKEGEFLGYLEVIRLFGHIVEAMRQDDIHLMILMDFDLLDVAVLMQNNPQLGGFILSHRNYNHALYEQLKGVDIRSVARQGWEIVGDYFLTVEPMLAGSGERVGYFLMALPLKKARSLVKSDDISLFLGFSQDDMVKIARHWEAEKLHHEGEWSSEDMEQLEEYDKSTLIRMLLGQYQGDPKRGEIR